MKLVCYYSGKARDLPGSLALLRRSVVGGWAVHVDKRRGCILYYNKKITYSCCEN